MTPPAVSDPVTLAQWQQICEIKHALEVASISWWLFGGWGLDVRLGRITRRHGDIEFWVAKDDGPRTRDVLVTHDFEALQQQHPEESQEFLKEGTKSSSAYFVRHKDGSYGPEGRWSDWHFPRGSFLSPPGSIDGIELPAMSVQGMLAMKQQFPTLRNGRPLRDKDIADIATLRALLRAAEVPHA